MIVWPIKSGTGRKLSNKPEEDEGRRKTREKGRGSWHGSLSGRKFGAK